MFTYYPKTFFPILFTLLLLLPAFSHDYMIGADVSFLKQAEENGTEFNDNGVSTPGLEILKNHGFNWVRLRLFVNPEELPNDLDYTIGLAKDAKNMGFKFLLDYHYSDTWADPAKQFTPAVWVDLTHVERVAAVEEYTRTTIAAFAAAGVIPDMVQIGNEIRPGMLWPDGRLPENWDNFADYFKAGVEGVALGKGSYEMPEIMLHYDQGGDKEGLRYFYKKFREYGIHVDVIGVSYYPWWHGSLLDLREGLHTVATEFQMDVVVVETAYHWRNTDETSEIGLLPFPCNPEGQKQFLQAVNEVVLQVPENRGKGVFWWEPMVDSQFLTSRSFFDDEKHALPVVSAFDSLALPLQTK